MGLLQRIQDLLVRVSTYPLWEVFVELAVIWVIVYLVVRFVQGTRAAGAMKGTVVVLLVALLLARVIGAGGVFARLSFLFDRLLGVLALALVVIFQPELRRAVVRVGEASFFRSSPTQIAQTVDAIVEACTYLSKSKFGAIIVIERESGLEGLIEGGTRLGAKVSARLLQTIFYPGSALHDLAVVIKGDVLHAASVQLPLAEPGDMPDPRLGARHRAAVGLTKDCDALVVVVSEETGAIRIIERGRLSTGLESGQLRDELTRRLQLIPPRQGETTEEEEAKTVIIEKDPA